jgi:hypothetical protein
MLTRLLVCANARGVQATVTQRTCPMMVGLDRC